MLRNAISLKFIVGSYMGEATASYNGKKTEKNNFFSNINTTDITHNKTFWKTVKPFFADKIKTKSKITLIEKKVVSQEGQEEIVSEKIITEDQAVAEVFNKFFINIVPNLKISTDHGYDNDFIATDDQVTNAVNKFRNHLSIIMIKNKKKKRKKLIKVFPLVP